MTPQEKIKKARTALILDQIFFGRLLLKLKLKEDPTCDGGWTDGKTLGYNSKWIESLTLAKTIGFTAHEVLHPVFQTNTRRNGRDKKLWNISTDFVINAVLIKAGFDLPDSRCYDPQFDGMNADQVYAVLEKLTQEQEKLAELEKIEGDGSGEDEGESKDEEDEDYDEDDDSNDENDSTDDEESEDISEGTKSTLKDLFNSDSDDPGGCGEVRDLPGEDRNIASPAELAQSEQDWKTATIQAATLAGDVPEELERKVEEIIHPKQDPREVLQQFVAMCTKNDYTWIRPNRRYIQQSLYLPDLKSEEIPNVVAVVDTSGSIDQDDLNQFAGWLSMVLEQYDTVLDVLYVDCQLHGHETFTREDVPIELHPMGGGGTDFRPAFEWIEKEGIIPSCLVYLTDLQCNNYPVVFPDYPVLWIVTEELGRYYREPPFGEVVEMNP